MLHSATRCYSLTVLMTGRCKPSMACQTSGGKTSGLACCYGSSLGESTAAHTPVSPSLPPQATRITKLARVLRLLRLLKLVKLLQGSPFFRKLEMLLGAGLLRLAWLGTSMALLTHWLACVFYLAAQARGEGPDTWVGLAGLAAAGL